MADGSATVTVALDPDSIWALVGDFDGLAGWMPGIDTCESDGTVRVITTMGMELREELKERDEAARRISYSVTESPMPVEHHLATISVEPAGSGSTVTWAWSVQPDEMAAAFGAAYEAGLGALKAKLER